MAKDTKNIKVGDEIAEFERKNPQIAKAMELFDITMAEYQGAMNAMNGAQIHHTSSSNDVTRGEHGKPR